MVALRSALLANVAAVASAVWLNGSKTRADLTSFGSICQSAEAWTTLTVNPTVSGVQNINFAKIEARTKAQLEDYERKITNKKNEVQSLEPRIAEAQKNEAVPYVDATAMGQFISKALAPYSKALAPGATIKDGGCGRNRKKMTARVSIRDAEAGFPLVVSEFFSASLFDPEVFDEEFDKIAGGGGIICDRVKQRLRDAVVAGGMQEGIKGSAKLVDEKMNLEKEISHLEEQTRQCKSDMTSIAAFQETMTKQKSVYNVREDELHKAEEQLYDSIEELEGLKTDLAEDEEKLAHVLEKLQKEGEKMEQAKTDLSDLQEADQQVKASLAEVTGKLKDVNERLTCARESDKVIEELRDAVSVTTLKMRLLFQEAALKPVMESGLSMQTNLNEVFFKSVGDIPGGDEVYKAAEDLTGFCTDEALPAFAKVKNPDLTPLCPNTDAGEIMNIVTDSMVERMESVKKLLKQVQSWFDPYKGQHTSKAEFTQEKAEHNVEMGEPEGLREIVGVFASSAFYQYLKDWTLEGKFLPLIAQLKDIMDELSKALKLLQAASADLKEKSATLDAKLQKAEVSLQQATVAAELPKADKEALEEEIESLKEQRARQMKVTDDFEKAVQLASERLKKAEESMIESYKAYHTQSFLQKTTAHALS